MKRLPHNGQTNTDKENKMASRPKDKASLIQDITNRYRVTAREARDIATAVGTVGKSVLKSPQEGISPRKAVKNLKKQVKEVGASAAKGKKGTSSAQLKPSATSLAQFGQRGGKGYVAYEYKKGKKRK